MNNKLKKKFTHHVLQQFNLFGNLREGKRKRNTREGEEGRMRRREEEKERGERKRKGKKKNRAS